MYFLSLKLLVLIKILVKPNLSEINITRFDVSLNWKLFAHQIPDESLLIQSIFTNYFFSYCLTVKIHPVDNHRRLYIGTFSGACQDRRPVLYESVTGEVSGNKIVNLKYLSKVPNCNSSTELSILYTDYENITILSSLLELNCTWLLVSSNAIEFNEYATLKREVEEVVELLKDNSSYYYTSDYWQSSPGPCPECTDKTLKPFNQLHWIELFKEKCEEANGGKNQDYTVSSESEGNLLIVKALSIAGILLIVCLLTFGCTQIKKLFLNRNRIVPFQTDHF